ncbi:hypothetical protein EX30DRAFT_256340 [Ascodesmis nigricans]|uniref:Uncharacterized protein n=1 Tax=Ascodesmis nigricans TaxID=341454 RepID=A0A4S2MHW0_9PEZI|nr:hypothetical protein EX30DRAFT_256340 [Ascodesmis nigricans]
MSCFHYTIPLSLSRVFFPRSAAPCTHLAPPTRFLRSDSPRHPHATTTTSKVLTRLDFPIPSHPPYYSPPILHHHFPAFCTTIYIESWYRHARISRRRCCCADQCMRIIGSHSSTSKLRGQKLSEVRKCGGMPKEPRTERTNWGGFTGGEALTHNAP